MSSSIEILLTIEEEGSCNAKELAKKLGISTDELEEFLKELDEKSLVEYDPKIRRVKLSQWLVDLNKQIENLKPATGTIILPKNQEVRLQDVLLENFTGSDLELSVRVTTRQKEIAICKTS